MLNFLKGLVSEDSSIASLGRIGFWIVFVLALQIWYTGNDIKEYHFYTIILFFAYNFSKKLPLFIDLIKAFRRVDKPIGA